MKTRNLLLALCCLFLNTFLKAQQWTSLSSGDFYGQPRSIYFTDANTGYAAAVDGKIFKTSDAGNVWDTLISGTTQGLLDIHFTNSNTGYAVGGASTIIKTIDAGNTWTTVTSGGTAAFMSIHFTDVNTGYVAESIGRIQKTTDAGSTWTIMASGLGTLESIYFTDVNTGYACGGSGLILKTINAGTTWTPLTTGTTSRLYSIVFTSLTTGSAVGLNGTIINTNNGGSSWTNASSGTTNSLHCIYFTNASTGYATGSNRILKTTDAGSTWTALTCPSGGTIYSIFFTAPNTAHIDGGSHLFHKTNDGGSTWSTRLVGSPQSVRGIYFTNASTGYSAVENYAQIPGVIRKTIDGGTTWVDLNCLSSSSFNAVHFTDVNTGYVIDDAGKIQKTIDAGSAWTIIASGVGALKSIYFTDVNTGYVCGGNGLIRKTINAGTTWTTLTTGTTQFLYSIFFTDTNTGYACGNGGIILKTSNGGINWTLLTSGTTVLLRSIYFTSANVGCAVGDGGTILRSINSGNTWSPISSGITQALFSICFPDNNIGFISGLQGKLLKSINAGSTWIPVNSGTSHNLFSLHFPKTYTGFSAGAYNTILKGDTCAGFSANLSGTNVSCYGGNDGTATADISGGNPSYSYLWSDGQTTSTATELTAGTYSVTIKMAGQQCPITKSILITQPSAPLSADVISTPMTKCSGPCSGSASIVNVSGGTPPYSYLWETGNQLTATAILCEGNYAGIITDIKGCSLMKTATINLSTVVDPNIYLTNLAAVDQVNVSPSFAAYYTYNLPASIIPPPSNPRNLVDPGKKARFKVECTNNKSNGLSIVSGICKVRTNNPYITITDSSSALNNIGWSNFAWSADEFEINIDPNTPPGTNVYIDFVVQESGQDYSTTCISIPITPLVYSPTESFTIDDDNNPDSQGNDNDICEPNETIEFYPWLDNISTLDAEYVRGRFENLDNHSFINIWNGVPGVGTTVYDATWWNYSFAHPQTINPFSSNTTPEYDFVFDCNNTALINDFKLYMVMACGFTLFSGNALSLVQWSLPYTFNNTGSVSVNEMHLVNSNINIYPNPSNGVFNIELSDLKETEAALYDITGKKVIAKSINTRTSNIDLSALSNGVYYLQLKNENGVSTKKIALNK